MARDIDSLLRQQSALAAFGSFAFRETDLTTILGEAARICAGSLGVAHCKIFRYRPDENDLLLVAGFGWTPDVVEKVVSKADESSPQGRALISGEPVVVRNLPEANCDLPPQFYIDNGIVTRVAVPIRALSGPPFGVLKVDSTREHIYDEHDIDFLTGFANVLAEAVATSAQNEALRASIASMTVMVAEQDRLLNERNLLALEVQHRVRNNLQLINDMVTTQLRQTSDEGGRKGLEGIIRQIMTLAEVYEHLLGVGMNGQIDFGAYTMALCGNLPDLQPPRAGSIALHCDAKRVLVTLASATALGLVLTELISNSYEHAFPGRDGAINVHVARGEQLGLGEITIADDGVGYVPAAESRRHGVGLACRLMQQVGGHLEVVGDAGSGGGGTVWTLRFPVLPEVDLAA